MSDLDGKREFRFTDIRGWKILNTTGHEIGRVEEVFVDPNTVEPMLVLLDYRKFLNFNTKKLLVPWTETQILGEGKVRTRPTEEQFADAPEWSDETTDWNPVTDYWSRRAMISSATGSS
jgi:sporulation protein YlmC with PRC-barrel domain